MTDLYTGAFLVAIISIVGCYFCTLSIPTGFVGVPYRFQQIVQPMLKPGGPHFYNPLTTKIILVETRPQTDVVRNIQCGTNDGVKVMLNKVEIGNQLPQEHVFNTISRFGPQYDQYLVTDLVIHQISVICSKHSAHEIAITKFDQIDDLLIEFLRNENARQDTGLQINFVRPSRPELPSSLDLHYLAIAEEKTLKKVLEEKQERIKIEKDSEMLVTTRNNEMALSVVDNENIMMLRKMKAKRDESLIANEMMIETAKAHMQAKKLEAEALESFFKIPGYAETEQSKHLSNNEKIYFGEKLPSVYPLYSTTTNMNKL